MKKNLLQTSSSFIFMDERKKFGDDGEKMVALALERQGFTIEHKNYRKKYGEIDIIASKKDLLIFVEIKRRKKLYFQLGEIITKSKQKKIVKTAQHYIAKYNQNQKYCRFDVALIVGENLTYIPNAFSQGDL